MVDHYDAFEARMWRSVATEVAHRSAEHRAMDAALKARTRAAIARSRELLGQEAAQSPPRLIPIPNANRHPALIQHREQLPQPMPSPPSQRRIG
jgi:hypothetical protein